MGHGSRWYVVRHPGIEVGHHHLRLRGQYPSLLCPFWSSDLGLRVGMCPCCSLAAQGDPVASLWGSQPLWSSGDEHSWGHHRAGAQSSGLGYGTVLEGKPDQLDQGLQSGLEFGLWRGSLDSRMALRTQNKPSLR